MVALELVFGQQTDDLCACDVQLPEQTASNVRCGSR